jgi:hypothetical protein
MMAPKLAALMTQQVISKSHLLIVLSDALYKASFFSIRCASEGATARTTELELVILFRRKVVR